MKSQYELYICDTSGAHEPITMFISATPFPTLQPGQRFDDHGWDRLRGIGKLASEQDPIRYTVHSLKTTILVEGEVNIIQAWVNVEPYTGDRSPAFGNTEPTMTSREAKNSTQGS